MSYDDVASLSNHISHIIENARNGEPRKNLSESARTEALRVSKQLVFALQKPEDTALEIALLPTLALCTRVGVHLGIFNILAENSEPITASQLAERTNTQKLLVVRIMRVLSTMGVVSEAGREQYQPTAITKSMANRSIQAGHIHLWDQHVNSLAKFPAYLDAKGLKSPEDPVNGLFQFSFNTTLESFDFWRRDPRILDNFNTFMEGVRAGRPGWIDWFPIQERVLDGANSKGPLLVDIGGARGHDLEAFQGKHPQPKGRLILEELSAVIDDIRQLDDRVERVKYDFFTPQPVIGARVYYFGHIFHCWPDKHCLDILRNLAPAMTKGYSKIIINEFILPDVGCSFFPAALDWVMLSLHGSMDRTQSQWETLLNAGGFKVVKFWAPPGDGEGVIEAMLAD